MNAFGIRGIIEGFYGKPWTHAERMNMLNFLKKCNLNTYFLAPKDEPGHRRNWRLLRTESQLRDLRELVSYASGLGITFGTAVSPGQTIVYSDSSELIALKGRLAQYLDLGINLIGVFFDDIPNDFQYESDLKSYTSLAQAHAKIGSQLYDWVQKDYPNAQLVICPTIYCGTGNEKYLFEIGESLNPKVHLFWTGLQICSYRLDVRDAVIFQETTNRKPLYWDNYPVNDVAMVHELHIGPLRARESGLVNFSEGLLANPMTQVEASKIALWTVGEYLSDPFNYDPDAAWDRGLVELISDKDDCMAFRKFARTSLGSCLNDDYAPEFTLALNEVALNYRRSQMPLAITKLKSMAQEITSSSSIIQSKNFSNLKLAIEAMPWVVYYRRGGEILEIVADCLIKKVDPDLIRQLASEVLSWRSRIFGSSLHMFLNELADDLSSTEIR